MNKNRKIFYLLLAEAFVVMIIGFWLGSMQELSSVANKIVAIGRWMGLVTTFAILLEVLLMSRLPFIEKNFDLDEISQLHRLNGFTILFGVIAHIVFITYGYSMLSKSGLINEFINMNSLIPDVLNATIGTIVFFIISLSSVKILRKKMSYEVWYFTHLLVYGAILLTFLHQINAGSDFVSQAWYKYYWIFLYVLVFGMVAFYRFARPFLYLFLHNFKVYAVKQESANCYSVYITGKCLYKFKYEPGQYATFRFLNKQLWHESHPFSFSSDSSDKYLRLTFKSTAGDYSSKLINLNKGTKVIIDGPRGSFISSRAKEDKVFLIAGGIGSAPLVSMIKALVKGGKKITFIYSAKSINDMAFYDQLKTIDGTYLNLVTNETSKSKRLDTNSLRDIYGSDINKSVTYICGPNSMTASIKDSLKELGVSKKLIIAEEFKF